MRKYQRLVSFVLAASLTLGAQLGLAAKDTSFQLHMKAGETALHAGDYAQARAQLDGALADTHKFQMNDPRLADTYFLLGELERKEQNFGQAKAHYERALEIQQTVPGCDELKLADTLWGLAKASEMLGDRQMAAILLKRVRDIWTRRFGPTSPQLLKVLKPLGIYETLSGDYPGAQQCYRDLIALQERINGADSPETASACNLLAMELSRSGKYADAEPLEQRALNILANAPQYSSLYEQSADSLMFIKEQLGQPVDNIIAASVGAAPPEATSPSTAIDSTLSANAATPGSAGSAVSKAAPPTSGKTQSDTTAAATRVDLQTHAEIKGALRPAATAVATTSQDFRPWETGATTGSAATAAAGPSTASAALGRIRYLSGGRLISRDEYDAMVLANQAYELIRDGKYKMASDILQKAITVCPQLASAHTNLGLVLTEQGQLKQAIEELKTAISINPTKSAPWVNLASAFQEDGQLKASVSTYDEFVRRFPSHAFVPKAREITALLNKEIAEQDAVALTAAANGGSANNYLAYASRPTAMRWPAARTTLRVYVFDAHGSKGYRSEFQGYCRDSFKQWSDASGKVAFEFVSKPAQADIAWVWSDDASKVASIAEGGETKVEATGKDINHATITVLTTNGSVDSPLSDNQMRAVCLHEIGHALGLLGHSPRPQDVMYCSIPPAEASPSLSTRDTDTIKSLYATEIGCLP